ncbi:MAG: Crp/Fnr family transcriptional regulator [Deltaproteobacteria bacterium]|nr:Crp/Fnr family transcriptional regulator [Deltaproteobacteria bacterium]
MARTPVLNVITLRRLKALPWATDHQLEKLLPHFILQHIERQTSLFSEGESSQSLYLLIAGAVKLSLRSSQGEEEILVSLIAPGEFFGITSLMTGMTRGFHGEAFSDCWVAVIQPEQFISTLLGIPFSSFSALMSSTVSRWEDLLYRYTRFQGLNLPQRLALALLELARKFGVQDARGVILILQLTHEDLANLVGASRQKVTEHLKDLERQEAILRDGRRLIVVPEKLQEIAGVGI